MILVVDTHPFLWYLENHERLGSDAADHLSNAATRLVIPTIVLAEVRYLLKKQRREEIFETVLEAVRSDPRVVIYPLSVEILTAISTTLEMHDSIICATANLLSDVVGEEVGVITRDREIVLSGLVRTIW